MYGLNIQNCMNWFWQPEGPVMTKQPRNPQPRGTSTPGNRALGNRALGNRALQFAGTLAIATACYHAKTGDDILREIAMSDDDMAFVTGTYQLGTMGWIAGGALLIGAARLVAQQARNLIVIVTAVLFGIPAFGTLALTGGEISGGGVALAAVVALALFGRKASRQRPATVDADQVARAIADGCNEDHNGQELLMVG